jgi:hypothetical protein
VALSEEGFFKPCFDWHQQRGMIFGCDHGGRGRNVVEFGDYFRTQRWNQGPGCDQPGLGRDLIKNKVASSIAHLYQRPRVWLEGYYGSGWGTNTEQLTDATFANFAQGQNLSRCTVCTTRPTAATGNGRRRATTSACPTGLTWTAIWRWSSV